MTILWKGSTLPSPGSASLQASFTIQTWLPEQVPMENSVCMRLSPQQQLGTAEVPAKLVGAPCTAQKLSVCSPCHAPPQVCLPLGPWPRGKCLTCREGPRKLFPLWTGLGSCVFQSRSQLGLKPSSNQVWRLLQDHRVDHEVLVMLPLPDRRQGDHKRSWGDHSRSLAGPGNSAVTGSGKDRHVCQTNLCLT